MIRHTYTRRRRARGSRPNWTPPGQFAPLAKSSRVGAALASFGELARRALAQTSRLATTSAVCAAAEASVSERTGLEAPSVASSGALPQLELCTGATAPNGRPIARQLGAGNVEAAYLRLLFGSKKRTGQRRQVELSASLDTLQITFPVEELARTFLFTTSVADVVPSKPAP